MTYLQRSLKRCADNAHTAAVTMSAAVSPRSISTVLGDEVVNHLKKLPQGKFCELVVGYSLKIMQSKLNANLITTSHVLFTPPLNLVKVFF